MVSLRTKHDIPCYDRDRAVRRMVNLTEAAHVLGISPPTLRNAVERGEIEADHPLPEGPWVFQRHALDTSAATTLIARVRRRTHEAAIPNGQQGALSFSRVSST